MKAPKMVYVQGEEMTRYGMQLILEQWIIPHIDITDWVFYDLSCRRRDDTNDQVLAELIDAGKRIGAIFKEPTITPTLEQKEQMGLKKAWGSPNGAMRRGWNGVTISRDTIMLEGLELGYKRPVFFDRHAVGGEYGAGSKIIGRGRLETKFYPQEGGEPITVDTRELEDAKNAAVTYHNPLDNVVDMGRHFFSRCLMADILPFVTTKKTVFKWQEPFWQTLKELFDAEYKEDFNSKGLLKETNGELMHIITDSAEMEMVKRSDGGMGYVAHNYDGDMLTDLMAQVHRSPGFISSALIGKADGEGGRTIMEFEASHGTVTAMDKKRLAGDQTSLNPLGLVYALLAAMDYSAKLEGPASQVEMRVYTKRIWQAMVKVMLDGRGTRDLQGLEGSTTEQFVAHVANELKLLVKHAA